MKSSKAIDDIFFLAFFRGSGRGGWTPLFPIYVKAMTIMIFWSTPFQLNAWTIVLPPRYWKRLKYQWAASNWLWKASEYTRRKKGAIHLSFTINLTHKPQLIYYYFSIGAKERCDCYRSQRGPAALTALGWQPAPSPHPRQSLHFLTSPNPCHPCSNKSGPWGMNFAFHLSLTAARMKAGAFLCIHINRNTSGYCREGHTAAVLQEQGRHLIFFPPQS